MDFKSTSFFLFAVCFLRIMCAANSYGDDKFVTPSYTISGGADDTATLIPLLLPPPPPPPPNKFSPFKPSIAVIVGVLTTMFSVTFLLLLYAKHCKRGNGGGISGMYGGIVGVGDGGLPTVAGRKNSGIDRAVIDSLPAFKFGSLRGQKDGLECAVCLTRFDSAEVLRLLPKCKHAFHVECVDTWLDAHSTCPLCRYRVDAEDILLVEDSLLNRQNDSPAAQSLSPLALQNHVVNSGAESRGSGTELVTVTDPSYRRVSGRHSSAGESGNNYAFLQIVLQKPGETGTENNSRETTAPATRRSLDSSNTKKKNTESVSLNKCFDHRNRKDGLLLLSSDQNRKSYDQRRFEHRIILSADHNRQRWSDVQPSDLLYLRSEMILSDSHRYSSGSRASTRPREHDDDDECGDGRNVIKTRSVSEITGLSRLAIINNENNHKNSSNVQKEKLQQRHKGVVSRWMAWISQSQINVRSADRVSICRH